MRNDYYQEAKEKHESCIEELQKAKEDGFEYYIYKNGVFHFYFTPIDGRKSIEDGLNKIWS